MSEETLPVRTISHIRRIVLIIISLFVIYHSVLHIESRNSCQWLLQHGKVVANLKWQPFGCLLYTYNKTDSKLCLRRAASMSQPQTHIVFLGDTRLLQLYDYITEHMFAKSTYVPIAHNYSIFDKTLQHDTSYDDSDLKLKIEFKWRPNPTYDMYLDFDELLHLHSVHKKRLDSIESNDAQYHHSNVKLNATNRIVIVGHSLWPIMGQDSHPQLIEAYKTNTTRLLTHIRNMKKSEFTTKILWSLQDPIVEKKLSAEINISNAQIDEFNYITEDLIRTVSIRDLTLLTSLRAITRSLTKLLLSDGIHSSDLIIEHKAQIILNYMCNRIYRFDGTCCSPVQDINLTQTFFIASAFLIISAYMAQMLAPYVKGDRSNRINTVKWQKVPQCDNTLTTQEEAQESDEDQNQNIFSENDQVTLISSAQSKSNRILSPANEELLVNLAKFSMAIIFMFICDRTNFFMKENKYFTLANFILPLVYVFALGIFFTEAQPNVTYPISTGHMLSRSQTNEWKGWMQLVVLIYNLSSAENNLRIYMLIRVLLSSYLFLTGFGHFTYFYKTGDTSVNRLCTVIVRLNLLVVCLCLCMNRPYQYYYFIPLVTFWFIILFMMMRIKPIKDPDRPSANDHFWLLFKISLLLGLITMLYLSEVFFEKIFLSGPWRPLFITSNDDSTIKEWWHNWSVDRYSVAAGTIYGLVHWTIVAPYLGITEASITPRAGHSRQSSAGSQNIYLGQNSQAELVLSNPLMTFQESIKPSGLFINAFALIGLSIYILFAATCSDKASCDEIHAYVSFVPIICYLILRNANEFLRTRHSILFAFIGKQSLELSLCQYHIWLAAGQRGLLVLVPNNPTMNLVITSIIFITTAHKLNSINEQLTHYATSYD